MRYLLLSVIVMAGLLGTGCGSSGLKESNVQALGPTSLTSKMTADDIAGALGMNSFLVEIKRDGNYGLTFRHSDGYQGTGFSGLKSGEVVKVIYWRENDFLKYFIKRKNGSCSSSISLKNSAPFTSMGCPQENKIYNPGDVVVKWTVNNEMIGDDKIIKGEAGLIFCFQEEATPIKSMNLVPNDGNLNPVQNKF